jgi:hypothetical protein
MYGELPSDLDEIEESMGPPPAWFRPEQGITSPQQAYYAQQAQQPYAFYGLGERESEMEVNPVEGLQNLKYEQEMNKKIPVEANRYTEINPLSPLFRDKKAKFGFGNFGEGSSTLGTATWIAMSASNAYHGYKRNGNSIGWGLGWLVLGFGPIGLVVSLVQGWGQPSDSIKLDELLSKPKKRRKKKKK